MQKQSGIPVDRTGRTGRDTRALHSGLDTAANQLRGLAPELSRLSRVGPIPDATLVVILDWSRALAADPAGGSAFSLDSLRTVLPALTVAYVCAHAYSRAEPGPGGRCIDLHDRGHGVLVGAVRSRLGVIATALHGAEGQRLIEADYAGLADHLNRIAEMIMAR